MMKSSSSQGRTGVRLLATGLLAALLLGSGAAGAFWWSCQTQSEAYDLSKFARVEGFMPLNQIPREALDPIVGQENVDAAERLASTQFNLAGDGLRTRLVRTMVARQIEQKFSPKEIAEFYLNDVQPGASRLHELAARDTAPKEKVGTDLQFVANTPAPVAAVTSAPPEFAPLPPAIDPVPVRRAIPIAARRAVAVDAAPALPQAPVLLADDIPVRRAQPVTSLQRLATPAWTQMGSAVPKAIAVTPQVRISPAPIYRIAVADE